VIIFTPSIDGEILVYDDRTLVFLPSETWKDQEYTLEVSQEVRSLLGLEMDGVVSQTFTPDIRYQGFELTISLDTYDWESWPQPQHRSASSSVGRRPGERHSHRGGQPGSEL
jgi:hypothetical protein